MSAITIAGDVSGTVTLDAPAVAGTTVLTLPATSGTLNTSGAVNVVPAGSAAAPAITTTGDTNTGMFFPAADTIAFAEGGTEAMRLDASGNVGIGTTSPSSKLQVRSDADALTFIGQIQNRNGGASTGGAIAFINSQNDLSDNRYSYIGAITTGSGQNGNNLVFATNPNAGSATERMRIDSNGNVLMGTTRTTGSGQDAAWFTSSGVVVTMTFGDIASSANGIFQYNRAGGGTLVRSGGSGGVSLASGATSWASASDENIKDIIEPIENGLEKVLTLRTVIGKYKNDEEGTRRAFLIAQDVQKVLPESISIINKGEDNEYLGLAYTDVIPLLVASIKELNAKVEAQAEQIKALQGAA